MAVIVPANLAPDTLPRVKGVILTRPWRGLWVVAKWPRKRGAPKSSGQVFTSQQFSLASKMAANPEPMSYETARFIAQDSSWLPRDVLVLAAYGKLYEVTDPDGNEYTQAWHGVPIPPPPPAWTLAWGTTLTTNSNAWGNVTFRQRIQAANIGPSGGPNTRVTFQASSTGTSAKILAAYIEQAALSGDQYDFAATPKQIMFGGAPNVVIPSGSSVVSDPIPFTPQVGRSIVISMALQSPTDAKAIFSGTPERGWAKAGNDAATVNASGYAATWNNLLVAAVETENP